MNEENINMLKARLKMLGFDANVEQAIRAQICFQPDRFEIKDCKIRETESCFVTVSFVKEGSTQKYDCPYYDMALRKSILIKDDMVDGVEVQKLDMEMSGINWVQIYNGRTSLLAASQPSLGEITRVAEIVRHLKHLSASVKGKMIADRLRFKYWSDTALETMLPNLGAIRSQYEINQRFYFFEEEKPISIEEGFRFLNSRWLEKQALLRKKLFEKVETEENGVDKGSGRVGNGLLSKRKTLKKKQTLKK
jgi:hypothetical protein